jgi:hypothetical protein
MDKPPVGYEPRHKPAHHATIPLVLAGIAVSFLLALLGLNYVMSIFTGGSDAIYLVTISACNQTSAPVSATISSRSDKTWTSEIPAGGCEQVGEVHIYMEQIVQVAVKTQKGVVDHVESVVYNHPDHATIYYRGQSVHVPTAGTKSDSSPGNHG